MRVAAPIAKPAGGAPRNHRCTNAERNTAADSRAIPKAPLGIFPERIKCRSRATWNENRHTANPAASPEAIMSSRLLRTEARKINSDGPEVLSRLRPDRKMRYL